MASQISVDGIVKFLYWVRDKEINFQKTFVLEVQWGSEIQTSLDFEWLKRGWVANGSDYEWDLEAQSFEIWTKKVWILNGSVF